MIRWLILLVLFVVALPYLYLAGLGLYLGLDVSNGIVTSTKGLLKRNLVYSEQERVDISALEVVRAEILWKGKLDNEQLSEASGLAYSPDQSVLFSVNDSGNPPELFALGLDGTDLGVWPVRYSDHHDFEDLARFELDGVSYLLIADTGDNFNWRPSLSLLVIAEPSLDTVGQTLEPAWTIRFRFPQDYRDVEGVAVDEKEENIYLISKRRIPAEVFRIPLRPDEPVTAEPVARLRGIPKPTARDLREGDGYGIYKSCPTAMDMRGRSAMIVTYKEAYLYRRSFRQSWDDAFNELPVRIPLPEIHGLESVAFGASADLYHVTGERRDGVKPTDVFEVRLP